MDPDGESYLTSSPHLNCSFWGVPIVAQRLINPTRIQGDVSLIPGLDQWVKDPALLRAVVEVTDAAQIWCCCCCGCGVGRQLQL